MRPRTVSVCEYEEDLIGPELFIIGHERRIAERAGRGLRRYYYFLDARFGDGAGIARIYVATPWRVIRIAIWSTVWSAEALRYGENGVMDWIAASGSEFDE
jgi:hypothetical protein